MRPHKSTTPKTSPGILPPSAADRSGCRKMKEDSRPRPEAQCLAVFNPVAVLSTYRTQKSVRTTRATPQYRAVHLPAEAYAADARAHFRRQRTHRLNARRPPVGRALLAPMLVGALHLERRRRLSQHASLGITRQRLDTRCSKVDAPVRRAHSGNWKYQFAQSTTAAPAASVT